MVHQMRYIDLFAGCGGISLGFYNAGLNGLFAVEQNSDAFRTLKHNLIDKNGHFDWPEWLPLEHWNIDTLLKEKSTKLKQLRRQVDLIVGGPPCQGFSSTGLRRASDKRNRLIHSYLDFIEVVQPRVIMFENVRGFTLKFSKSKKYKKIAYSEIVMKKLKNELGYSDACGKIINLAEYGVPQQRERYIMIATRNGSSERIFTELEEGCEEFLLRKDIQRENNSWAAISDLERRHGIIQCPDSSRFMSGVVSSPQHNLQKFLRLSDQDTYTPDSHRFVNHTSEVEIVFERLLERAPRNKRICGEDREIYGVKKRNVTVLDPEKPSLTITTIPDDFVHYSEPRVMTVRECARLQSFPDWYEFKGPYTTGGKRRVNQTPRYTQVGNAVPPLFAEQLGLAIKRVMAND